MDDLKPGTIALNGASLDLSYSGICPIADRERVLEISNLLTEKNKRRQNCANSLMQEVCEQADQSQKLLLIMPQAFDNAGPTTEQLIDWYKMRFGFIYLQESKPVILIRLPIMAAEKWASENGNE